MEMLFPSTGQYRTLLYSIVRVCNDLFLQNKEECMLNRSPDKYPCDIVPSCLLWLV